MCHRKVGVYWKQRMLLAVEAGLMQTTANHMLIVLALMLHVSSTDL